MKGISSAFAQILCLYREEEHPKLAIWKSPDMPAQLLAVMFGAFQYNGKKDQQKANPYKSESG